MGLTQKECDLLGDNIYSFRDFVCNRHVESFVILYKRLGKAAAGALLKEAPTKYKSEIIKIIKERLNESV